jgi:S-formylglutathione hydrolase FrmB
VPDGGSDRREHTGQVISPLDRRSGRRLTRRGFLTGAGVVAAAGAAVAVGVLPGRSWVYRHFGPQGVDGVVPRVPGGRTVSGSFVSEARLGKHCGWTIAYPPGHQKGLPVAVVLHGRHSDHTTAFSPRHLALDRYLAAVVRRGAAPFALASVDGGDTYWHARSTGEDAGAMVRDELLPLLTRHGLDVERPAFLGWSMGGYAALRLGGEPGPDRVAAVVAESPALWHDFDDTSPGSFDDAADFADATVSGRQHRLDGIPVRIDCGEGDPFYAATRDYVDGFEVRPAGGFEPGGHDFGYWRRMAPAQLRFIARAFSG